MADRLLVPLTDGRWLAMGADEFDRALSAGAFLHTAPRASGSDSSEPLLSSEKLAEVLSVPASWLEKAALERRIPSLEFGRWRRFKRSEVEAAVRSEREGE